jgi:hypothetical protein
LARKWRALCHDLGFHYPSAVPEATGIIDAHAEMRDLAPAIERYRLVVEGCCAEPIDGAQIEAYLSELSDVCEMRRLNDPVTHRSDRFGWAGWVHWEASGAHMYSWERPVLFFSIDIYTCKAFDHEAVVGFTGRFFRARDIVAKRF